MLGHDINIVHGVVSLYSIALYIVEWMHFIRNLWADKNNQNHQILWKWYIDQYIFLFLHSIDKSIR